MVEVNSKTLLQTLSDARLQKKLLLKRLTLTLRNWQLMPPRLKTAEKYTTSLRRTLKEI